MASKATKLWVLAMSFLAAILVFIAPGVYLASVLVARGRAELREVRTRIESADLAAIRDEADRLMAEHDLNDVDHVFTKPIQTESSIGSLEPTHVTVCSNRVIIECMGGFHPTFRTSRIEFLRISSARSGPSGRASLALMSAA
jgi:hypothetical protein